MKYDFDTVTDRRNTGSFKWDIKENEIPMWVADMDFKTAPAILEALQKRVEHGIFGYNIIPDEWYAAIINWWKTRHNYEIAKDSLIFSTGVVPTLSSVVRKLTTVGENVVVQTPVYNIFFNSIVNNGRNIVESPLAYDGESYSIDFCDLEEKLSMPQTSMMILCNPHNPIGKIWDRDTLAKIGELCKKHHVTVVSDEIHCDLTAPGTGYIPFQSVSDDCKYNSVACIAPTKAFGIPGLQTSAVVVPDPVLRHRVNRGLNTDEVAEPNSFACDAVVAAFDHGGEWLDELREYIEANKQRLTRFVNENIPEIKVIKGDATYLMWLDCRAFVGENEGLENYIREKTGLFVTDGAHYGNSGKGFIRVNVACPRVLLEDGLNKLKAAFDCLRSEK